MNKSILFIAAPGKLMEPDVKVSDNKTKGQDNGGCKGELKNVFKWSMPLLPLLELYVT